MHQINTKVVRRITIVFLAIGLNACATVPMTSPSLDMEAKKFIPETGKASIYVNRSSLLGTAVTIQVILDGRIVGALPPKTYLLMNVTPGPHTIMVRKDESLEYTKINAVQGKNYFFEASLNPGWKDLVNPFSRHAEIKTVTEKEGRDLIINSKRAVALTYKN